MGVEVFRVPLYRRYLADRLTCGYCLALFFWFTVIVLPFFMAYTSESFWMKRNILKKLSLFIFFCMATTSFNLSLVTLGWVQFCSIHTHKSKGEE